MPDDDFFIRNFARARDAGNMAAALKTWEDACLRKADFVKGLIRKHKFPGGSRLAPQDREDAQTECMLRILQMGHNFRGTTGAEFRAAIMRAVYFGSMDVGRDVLAYEEHIGGSLDDRYEDSDGGRFDGVVENYLREVAQHSANVADADEELQRAEELVAWAIPQITNENYRTVLHLTFIDRLTGEEIASRLDINIDNVYQRRKRGLTKLEEILRANRP